MIKKLYRKKFIDVVKLLAIFRFLKVMAMVWAGSQVTKLIRAGG